MTVVSPGTAGKGVPLARTARRGKVVAGKRPVTATLDYPVILDVTFLKKLDMTSFTKKGLVAISKICGISLVKLSEDAKTRKRRLRRRSLERGRKEGGSKGEDAAAAEEAIAKWATIKRIPTIKVSAETPQGTSAAAAAAAASPRARSKAAGRPSVDDILRRAEVVAEPCKACGRSEQPERFHSHPKQGKRDASPGSYATTKVDRAGTSAAAAGDVKLAAPTPAGKAPHRRHSTGRLSPDAASRLAVKDVVEASFHSDHEIESIKMSLPKKGDETYAKKSASARGKDSGGRRACPAAKQGGDREDGGERSVVSPGSDLRFVTGCYVCGRQMSPTLRIAHEEECIAEWRRRNSRLPPDRRAAEPLRPDFRFTATGGVDLEGTFTSIWANHVDSLVPCGKCGRTFFPERIERHEACCNVQPVRCRPRNK